MKTNIKEWNEIDTLDFLIEYLNIDNGDIKQNKHKTINIPNDFFCQSFTIEPLFTNVKEYQKEITKQNFFKELNLKIFNLITILNEYRINNNIDVLFYGYDLIFLIKYNNKLYTIKNGVSGLTIIEEPDSINYKSNNERYLIDINNLIKYNELKQKIRIKEKKD